MDDIRYEKLLNRIIQGRLRLRVGDLVLYIEEPSRDIKEESFEVYDKAFEKAYFDGCYIQSEMFQILLDYELWNPGVDKRSKQIEEEVENLKLEAYKNYLQPSKLITIKRDIFLKEKERVRLLAKKEQLSHLTCKGVATMARGMWLLSKSCKDIDGNIFDFKTSNISINTIMDIVRSHDINPSDIRYISRNNPWRQMWNGSKKRESVFGKNSVNLDQNQLALISYSQMYDNVYESIDTPPDLVIEDDDCLDGWFISQKREREKDKKQKAIDAKLSNSKIANSQEVMLVANNQEEIDEIYSMNSPQTRQIVSDRQNTIKSNQNINFKELPDVKQQRMISATQQTIQAVKNRNR